MDQDAFRKLLETPRAGSSASQTPRARFGQAPPKRGGPTPKDEFAKPEMKPRSQKTKEWQQKKKQQQEAELYRDRAKERRLGKEGDFSAAEKLLEEFQARAETSDIDKETMEEQMKYLGGDAEHSVLVKGLDFALLERQKYEAARKAEAQLGDVEDELDRALASDKPPSPSSAAQPKKRTRDDMLAELRAKREADGVAPPAAASSEGLGKGFKPIGFKPIGKGDGERKKKKKKKVEEVVDGGRKEGESAAPVVAERRMAEPLIAAEVDDEDDIFGDAGEWKPEDDSDSDDENGDKAKKPPPTNPVSAPPPPRERVKYFDDDDDDLLAASTAPIAITNLANQPQEPDAPVSRPLDDGEEDEERPMRLQGLSSSALPSARELLEMDAAQAAAEKRKERKAKYKASAEEKKAMKEANMTDADKLNRDHQEMERYLEKQKQRKSSN